MKLSAKNLFRVNDNDGNLTKMNLWILDFPVNLCNLQCTMQIKFNENSKTETKKNLKNRFAKHPKNFK